VQRRQQLIVRLALQHGFPAIAAYDDANGNGTNITNYDQEAAWLLCGCATCLDCYKNN
jgi:hypothetical protein